ncbi:NAD(P)H-hydrate epimerase [Peptoniphilus sp.]|jgi:NAD(P)H-hydrate epimerase|uniref:NAD(P)H-hydrate epimerase n=1 Tax=Peptoniphilus sp. TaxID=1971214 RepID=UPI003D929395
MAISIEKMKELEKRTIEDFGVNSLVLMENAGMAIFNEIKDSSSFTIVCGSGNNGGDGLVIARHLILSGKEVEIFIVGDKKSKDFATNLDIVKKLTDRIFFIEEDNYDDLVESLEVSEVTVDAIFGTGLNRNLSDLYIDVINLINLHGNYIISVDIPSGMDGNTGDEYGACVRARKTYAITDIKEGELLNSNSGELNTVYIGIVRYRDE